MDVLLQIQADQLGVPVVRAPVAETTALGAAYLAGIAEGVWSGLEDVAALSGQSDAERRFQPDPDRRRADAGYAQWQRALRRSLAWDQSE